MAGLLPILATKPAPLAWQGIVRYLNPVAWWAFDDPQLTESPFYYRPVSDISGNNLNADYLWWFPAASHIPGDPYGHGFVAYNSGGNAASDNFYRVSVTDNPGSGDASYTDPRFNGTSGTFVYVATMGGSGTIIQRYSETGGDWSVYRPGLTNTWRIDSYSGTGTDPNLTPDPDISEYIDNDVHLVVVTWSTTAVRLYIDGELKQTASGVDPSASAVPAFEYPRLTFQGGQNTTGTGTSGRMDDALWFDRRLTATDIQNLYAGFQQAYAAPRLIMPGMTAAAVGDAHIIGPIDAPMPKMSFETQDIALVEMNAPISDLAMPGFDALLEGDAVILGTLDLDMPGMGVTAKAVWTPVPDGPVTITMPGMSAVLVGKPVLGEQQEPTPGAGGVVRWEFYEHATGDSFTFWINPQTATSPYPGRRLNFAYGVRNNLDRIRTWQERPDAKDWTFTGKAYNQQQYDDLNEWCRKGGIVRVTNHLGQSWDVLFQSFKPTDRTSPAVTALDRYSYEISALIVRGNRPSFGRPALR